ncbi:MAG: hypothetical protein C0483_22810 [Pirellula sp.]|nr:hypothetical protein [Pirellula sp.]
MTNGIFSGVLTTSMFFRTVSFGILFVGAARPSAAQSGTELISNPVAQQLGLERMWSTALRVDPARGRVENVVVHRGLIVAQTNTALLQGIDAETGRTYWVTEIGKANYQTQVPAVNDKYVAATNGDTLYLLDRSTGAEIWSQRLGNAPSAGPAISDDRIYVPLDGGLLEGYKIKRERLLDHVPTRFSGTGGTPQSPVTVGNRVLWTTDKGYVYSREQAKELIQFRFRMNDAATAAPLYMSPFVYAASRSGTVYCLDEITGLDVWQAGGVNSFSRPLIAIDGKLFAISETGQMLRLNPLTGIQMWYTTGIAKFLAAGAKNLYLLDAQGRLQVLDAETGGRRGSMPVAGIDLTVRNTSSDRIYLGTSTGMLQCLRERAQSKPLEHTAGFAIAPKPKEGALAPAATDAAPAADVPGSPFGTPAPTPAAPAGEPSANPFGS